MYLTVFACCLAVMWGHVVGSRLWSIYGNGVSSLCTYYSSLLQASTLLPLPLLCIEITILWDQICLDQSTCIGNFGSKKYSRVLSQWNSGWICYHSIYSSILANSGQSDWNCVTFLYSLQSHMHLALEVAFLTGSFHMPSLKELTYPHIFALYISNIHQITLI